jgi:hypothetical protein
LESASEAQVQEAAKATNAANHSDSRAEAGANHSGAEAGGEEQAKGKRGKDFQATAAEGLRMPVS